MDFFTFRMIFVQKQNSWFATFPCPYAHLQI